MKTSWRPCRSSTRRRFGSLSGGISSDFEESEKEMNEKKKQIKEGGLGLMKAVKAYRKSAAPWHVEGTYDS